MPSFLCKPEHTQYQREEEEELPEMVALWAYNKTNEEEEDDDDDEITVGSKDKVHHNINDNADLLAEILSHLDGRSLAAAAAVCRLWSVICSRDSVWEAACRRNVAGGEPASAAATRAVVSALGGWRRLYRLCVGPALERLSSTAAGSGPSWTSGAGDEAHLSLSLSLSLFSIECYERLGGSQQRSSTSKSLLFLSKPVNAS